METEFIQSRMAKNVATVHVPALKSLIIPDEGGKTRGEKSFAKERVSNLSFSTR